MPVTVTLTEFSDNSRLSLRDEIIYALGGSDIVNAAGGDDIVYGQLGHDTLYGGTGNDTLYGDEGDDKLYGEAGNDTLYGGIGADTLDGGLGNDRLTGGAGDDILTGGAGSDRYIFNSGQSFNRIDLGTDQITRFDPKNLDPLGSFDKIVLDKTTFNAITGSSLVDGTSFVTVNSISDAATQSALIVYDRSTGSLMYNPNRDLAGFADLQDSAATSTGGGIFAVLQNRPNLSASDFLIQA